MTINKNTSDRPSYHKLTTDNIHHLKELYRSDDSLPSTPEEVKEVTKMKPSDLGKNIELVFPRCIEIDPDTQEEYMVTALWEDYDFMWFIVMVKVTSRISLSAIIPTKILQN